MIITLLLLETTVRTLVRTRTHNRFRLLAYKSTDTEQISHRN